MAFPTLNNNLFYTALVNGFKYMNTVADNLSALDDTLVAKYKIDGGEFQDQLVYTDMDLIKSYVWDPTDTNVLATGSKVAPVQQAIPIDQKRQINLYVDNGYLSKRVWMGSGSWEGFRSVVVSQMANTKKLYDQKMVYTAIGTMVNTPNSSGLGAKQNQTITLATVNGATAVEKEAQEKSRARQIGKKVADIFVELKDANREYNDYGFMKAFDQGSCTIIWNKDFVNEFEYVDLPLLYGNAGKTQSFEGVQLPGSYFGTEITETNYSTYSATTPAAGKPIDSDDGTYVPGSSHANGYLRALQEMDITVSGTTTHVFPGDELPASAKVYDSTKSAGSKVLIPCYIVDAKVICKIVHNDAIVYPVSWLTNTNFFNAKNLSTNMYETWYFGKPAHRKSYPLITIKEA